MDTPETFANALLLAAVGVAVGSRAVVAKGALNVKNEARANVQQSAPIHNAHAAEAITYDIDFRGASVTAEIGYDKDRPGGSLGNILEYGSENNPPHRDIGRAADHEEARFASALAVMAARLL